MVCIELTNIHACIELHASNGFDASTLLKVSMPSGSGGGYADNIIL
jgi:hypothetical protein